MPLANKVKQKKTNEQPWLLQQTECKLCQNAQKHKRNQRKAIDIDKGPRLTGPLERWQEASGTCKCPPTTIRDAGLRYIKGGERATNQRAAAYSTIASADNIEAMA